MSEISTAELDSIRVDLAAAYRLADRFGLNEGISNHFTARVPGEDLFLVIPHGLHWSEVRASRLIISDEKGNVVEGDGEVEPSALFIHSRILRERKDISCVLHTHQTFATTLSLLDSGRLLPLSQNSLRFHRRVTYDEHYAGAADHSVAGKRIAKALGRYSVLFHANHGVIVVGESIARAFDDLYFLERACQVQILAQATGQKLRLIPDDVAEGYVNESRPNNLPKQAAEHFAALKRLLDLENSPYAE